MARMTNMLPGINMKEKGLYGHVKASPGLNILVLILYSLGAFGQGINPLCGPFRPAKASLA